MSAENRVTAERIDASAAYQRGPHEPPLTHGEIRQIRQLLAHMPKVRTGGLKSLVEYNREVELSEYNSGIACPECGSELAVAKVAASGWPHGPTKFSAWCVNGHRTEVLGRS